MKLRFTYLLVFLVLLSAASAQTSDDFSDGNFTANPIWTGQDSLFEVLNEELHLLDTLTGASGTAYLSTPNTAIENATWSFYVRADRATSSSNLIRIYLVSDRADLSSDLNGYYVQIGNTSDEISLYRQNGSTRTEIIDGRDDVTDTDTVNVWVEVTRDATGNWELRSDTLDGSNLTLEGDTFDNTFNQNFHSGVFFRYSSTAFDKYFLDDFVATGTPFNDIVPPTISNILVVSDDSLTVCFSEPIDPVNASVETNYSVDLILGTIFPGIATPDPVDPTKVHLLFAIPFSNGATNCLTATNITDLANPPNTIVPTPACFTFVIPEVPAYRDVVINEILADNAPPSGVNTSLPRSEYIELHNPSTKFFDLEGWQLSDGGTFGTFPSYTLPPGGFVIVAPADSVPLFGGVTNIIGLKHLAQLEQQRWFTPTLWWFC